MHDKSYRRNGVLKYIVWTVIQHQVMWFHEVGRAHYNRSCFAEGYERFTEALMRSDIDLSRPRNPLYRHFDGDPGPCPQCGGRLLQTRQAYAVATRRGRKQRDSFILSSDFGWFCVACPAVVINSRRVSAMLQYSMPNWDVGNEFCVQGIVDLDAVPKHKRDVPFGEEGNPVPLIAFENPDVAAPRPPLNKKERQQRNKRAARKLKSRRGQNTQDR
jgi:hypothetical protein